MDEKKVFDDVEVREGEVFTEETVEELTNGKGEE